MKAYEVNQVLHIDFEEKNEVPQEFQDRSVHSKDFLPSSTIEDFPLRGKSVRRHVKRRRWTGVHNGDILQRDWTLVAKGTKMTADFAAFLKVIGRY